MGDRVGVLLSFVDGMVTTSPDEVKGIVAVCDWLAHSNARVAAAQAVLGLALYGLVLNAPLFFDDQHFISWNQHVSNFDLAEIYSSSVTEGAGFQSNTYRPNQQFVFALIYKFFELSPVPYHLVSLIIHVVNALLVFCLLEALSLHRTGSFLASLVFLVHPIQTQSVSYVSGLAGPLALAFLLGGFLAWIASLWQESSGRRAGLFAAALMLFVGAFFTKSDAVILSPLTLVLAIYFVLTGRIQIGRYLVLSLASFALLAFGFLAVKLTLLNFAGTSGMVTGSNLYTENLHVRLITFVSVIDRYIEMIVWPAVLSYGKPRTTYPSLVTPHGLAGLVALAFGAFAALRARQSPLVFLGCGWFFAALAPFSGLIPLTAMYLEHWLYVPLIGPLIGLAGFYSWATPATRRRVVVVAALVLPILMVRTVVRNYQWADAERFYLADMRAVGASVQMLNNLAIHLDSVGQTDRAIEALRLIVKTSDTTPEPHVNLARIHAKRSEYGLARTEYLRALELDPTNLNGLIGLRDLYDARGKIEQALKLDRQIRGIERDLGLDLGL